MGIIKKVVRSSKNIANSYTDIEKKVREATSVDAWMVSTQVLREISDATYDSGAFMQIMNILFKRMGDSGKYWRHVLKSLLLLDYLLKNGAPRVLRYAKENIHHVKTLKEFTYDETDDGVDHGHDIREKSKLLCQLLKNEELLEEERQKASDIRDRLVKNANIGSNKNSAKKKKTGYDDEPTNAAEEERQLQQALRNSRKGGAETDAERQLREDAELALALSASETLAKNEEAQRRVKQSVGTSSDPFATPATAGNAIVDPFAASAPSAPETIVNDPFASVTTSQPGKQQAKPQDPFANPIAAPPQATQSSRRQQTRQYIAPTAPAVVDPFDMSPLAASTNQSVDPFVAGHGSTQQTPDPFGAQPVTFGAPPASDAHLAGPPVSQTLLSLGGPQAQLAGIARNAVEIDGFSQLAHSSSNKSNDPFAIPPQLVAGTGSDDPFSAVARPQQQPMATPQPHTQSLLTPFGSSQKPKIDTDEDDGSLWKNKKLINLDEIVATNNAPVPVHNGSMQSTPNNPFALSSGPVVSAALSTQPQPVINPFKQNATSSPNMNSLLGTQQGGGFGQVEQSRQRSQSMMTSYGNQPMHMQMMNGQTMDGQQRPASAMVVPTDGLMGGINPFGAPIRQLRQPETAGGVNPFM